MSHRPRRAPSEDQIVSAILDAYRRGYFPMADGPPPWNPFAKPQIHWFSPDPRGVLPMTPEEGLHIPSRLASRLRNHDFDIRIDSAFEDVMRGCALPRIPTDDAPDNDRTWIDATLINWFGMLHRHGHAHSIEAWRIDPDTCEERLVGGLYGVSIGTAFFGESMFHIPQPRLEDGARHPFDGTDASKICLVLIVRALAAAGYTLFDTQMVTSHVSRFGGREIPRRDYLLRLKRAIAEDDRWPAVSIA